MKLGDKFEVRNTTSGSIYFLSRKDSGDFELSWNACGVVQTSYWKYTEERVIEHINAGTWEIISPFAVRLAFFQQHIDAVEENLASLKKAFEELKQEAT